MNSFLIGAATSNSGKTTVSIGLMRALRKRGLTVQPYKCGPDYIDTKFHTIACGNESVNLDTWLSSKEHVRHVFHKYGKDADMRVVEGVMGLYDGYDRYNGSSGEIAMLLDIPVILVVNAKSVAYPVAPLIYGFNNFSVNGSHVKIAGVIFNMVSSDSHYHHLKSACDDAGIPCLGYISNNPRLSIPGRHLGLSTDELDKMEELIELCSEEIEKHVDMTMLIRSVYDETSLRKQAKAETHLNQLNKICEKRIAIARDEAFNFTYRANIDALARNGEIVYFSPLADQRIPACDWLYLPGGYPELYAERLYDNKTMRDSIKEYAEHGGHIYAECGGLMYLSKSIEVVDDVSGSCKKYDMCGVLPIETTMEGARLHLGYRMLKQNGRVMRGHEFHYSKVKESDSYPRELVIEHCQYTSKGAPADTCLYRYRNVVAGYTHWYWGDI